MTQLAWRKEPPDRPGWWWRTEIDHPLKPPPEVVRAAWGFGGEILAVESIFSPDAERRASSMKGYFWAGPIEPPERREG